MERTKGQHALQYIEIALVAILGALNYEIFVFANDFAPAGLNGICTLIQHVFHFSFGSMSLLINIPLLLVTFTSLDPHFARRNLVYVLVFSITSILFKRVDFSSVQYVAHDGGEAIMAAFAAGVFNGAIYSVTIHCGGSTGGMDIVAAFVNKKHPEYSLVWIIFAINLIVAILSFFAYGFTYTPVILCLLYCLITSAVNSRILNGMKSALKFEIITTQPDELAHALMTELKHGCTVVRGKGMYSHTDRSLIICVVNKLQVADFEHILRQYKDCFVIASSVKSTYGNFKHIK